MPEIRGVPFHFHIMFQQHFQDLPQFLITFAFVICRIAPEDHVAALQDVADCLVQDGKLKKQYIFRAVQHMVFVGVEHKNIFRLQMYRLFPGSHLQRSLQHVEQFNVLMKVFDPVRLIIYM